MSQALDCGCNPCLPAVTEIPGTAGADGTPGEAGAAGTSSYTISDGVAGPFDRGDSLNLTVLDTTAFPVGATIAIAGVNGATEVGYFEITSKAAHQFTLLYLDISANTDAQSIAAGNIIAISGPPSTPGALQAAMTDNSTGAASATIAAGVGVFTLTIPLTSLVTGLGVLAIDLLTNYVPGYAFKLLKFDFVTTVAGTGAGASQVFNLEIGTTNVTNTLTVNLASTAAIGQITLGTPSPIVALNTGTATDTLSIEMAAGGTVFTAGAGYFVIKIQNMDEANAAASFAANFNTLRTALS